MRRLTCNNTPNEHPNESMNLPNVRHLLTVIQPQTLISVWICHYHSFTILYYTHTIYYQTVITRFDVVMAFRDVWRRSMALNCTAAEVAVHLPIWARFRTKPEVLNSGTQIRQAEIIFRGHLPFSVKRG